MPDQNNPETINIFEQYVQAVFAGIGSVVIDYANMIAHPLDNLLYPVANLAYDAAIIAAGHEINSNPNQLLNGDFVLLQRFVAQNPQTYLDAIVRMQERVDKLKALGPQFLNGTGPQRVEMAVHAFGHILVPGFIIKGIKSVANLNIATRINPPRFVDMYQDPPTFPRIPQNSLSEIRATTGKKNALYVITTDKKLLIAFEQQPLEESGRFVTRIHHNALGRTEDVLGAGEVLFRDGELIGIDTNAGRYHPQGTHLKKFTEKIFIKEGFKEAKDRFFDINALHNNLPLLPRQVELKYSPYVITIFPLLQGITSTSPEKEQYESRNYDLIELLKELNVLEYFYLAQELYAKNDLDHAINEANKALLLNPYFTKAYLLLHNCYKQEGQLEKTFPQYGTFRALVSDEVFYSKPYELCSAMINANNIKIYLKEGWDFFNNQKYSTAIEKANEVLNSNINEPAAYELLAMSYYQMGDFEETFECLRNLKKLSPLRYIEKKQTAIEHYNKGIIFFSKQDYENTLYEFDIALNELPDFQPAYIESGLAFWMMSDHQKAIYVLELAKKLGTENDLICYYLALIYYDLNEFQDASENINNALKLLPSNVEYLSLQAEIKEYESYFQQRQEAIDHFYNAVTFFDKKDYKNSIVEANAAIRFYPNFFLAYSIIGDCYCIMRDFGAALTNYKKSLEIARIEKPRNDEEIIKLQDKITNIENYIRKKNAFELQIATEQRRQYEVQAAMNSMQNFWNSHHRTVQSMELQKATWNQERQLSIQQNLTHNHQMVQQQHAQFQHYSQRLHEQWYKDAQIRNEKFYLEYKEREIERHRIVRPSYGGTLFAKNTHNSITAKTHTPNVDSKKGRSIASALNTDNRNIIKNASPDVKHCSVKSDTAYVSCVEYYKDDNALLCWDKEGVPHTCKR